MRKLILAWASLGFAVWVASPLMASEVALEDAAQDLSQTPKSPVPNNDTDDRHEVADFGAAFTNSDEENGIQEEAEEEGYESPDWDFVDQASPRHTDDAHQEPTTPDLPSSPKGSPVPPQNS